jgi:hypothetical protein
MTDLAAWILERIAEDEATARAYRDGDWSGNPYAGDGDGSDLRYAERFDPARVLAQCAAYKMVVYLHGPYRAYGEDICASCGRETPYPCRTLRALASVWVDHPDYDPVWRLA